MKRVQSKIYIKANCPTESQEQVLLMQWWALQSPALGIDERLLFHIPNGRQRSARDGRRLKLEGVRPGVPDLFLAVTRDECPGLWIELKRVHGGRVTVLQNEFQRLLHLQGYRVVVCYGWESAKNEIMKYIKFGDIS